MRRGSDGLKCKKSQLHKVLQFPWELSSSGESLYSGLVFWLNIRPPPQHDGEATGQSEIRCVCVCMCALKDDRSLTLQ